MKKNLLLLAIIISLPSLAQISKKAWKNIPNQTSILISTNGQTVDENFKQALNTLLDNNIEIDKHDRSLGTITTAWHPLPRTGSYKLNIRCTEGRIQVTGQLLSGISMQIGTVRTEDSPEAIKKTGSRNSINGIAFSEMYIFAEQLGTVTW